MKTEILIVSYAHDIPYLNWCLKSISKFSSGFSGLTLVVPEEERAQFNPMMVEYPHGQMRWSVATHKQPGHLGAQLQKCLADKHCPDADFILHTDSDCIFTEPVTPEDYFVGGKPVMCIAEYRKLPPIPWRAVTEKALGLDCPWETMRRHPQVNPRGVYNDMRQRVSLVNDCLFEHYVMAQKSDYPWGFSEHNCIGSFAHETPRWKSEYHWVDVGSQTYPAPKLMQYWSHAAPDQMHHLPSGGMGRPLDDFKRLGL
jgi:hypothetical protein